MNPLGQISITPWLGGQKAVASQTQAGRKPSSGGVFWRGADGQVYVSGAQGTNAAGRADANTASYWGSRGFTEIADPNSKTTQASTTGRPLPASNVTGGAGYTAPAAAPKVLDTAQLGSLDSLLRNVDTTRDQMKQKAATKRDTAKREKGEERKREKGKYDSKKVSTMQEFAGAKTDTDINTRDTLENLMSSLSTMGLGGSRALTRQILSAANMSNRKANATQATNNQGLDSAWNEFDVNNSNDLKKVDDQYGYETGEADRKWAQDYQSTLYKKADVYGNADLTGERERVMNEGNNLNAQITGSTFMNPSYTGEARAMATPELAAYNQDIATYDTAAVGGATPVGGSATPGNLAIKAIAVNDKDLGVKKKQEGLDPVYGV